MDEAVRRALERWPNVPDVFGWLSLTRRGQWRLRGEPICHRGLIEFIQRNYGPTDGGAWCFQNGPQRVFASLECAPLVFRLVGDESALRLAAHTGAPADRIEAVWLDEEGSVLLSTDAGPGVISDRDLSLVANRLIREDGLPSEDPGEDAARGRLRLRWNTITLPVLAISREDVPRRLGFIRDPAPRAPTATTD